MTPETFRNDEDELGRYGVFKKSRAHVAKHDDQNNQQDGQSHNEHYDYRIKASVV